MDRTLTKVCKCENCGNEAEMVVTCALPGIQVETPTATGSKNEPERVKGTATCTHCGNEADMWIDL